MGDHQRGMSKLEVFCPECGQRSQFDACVFHCSCGGAWEPLEKPDFPFADIDRSETSLWRYRKLFGLAQVDDVRSLGAGWTPLLPVDWRGREVWSPCPPHWRTGRA